MGVPRVHHRPDVKRIADMDDGERAVLILWALVAGLFVYAMVYR